MFKHIKKASMLIFVATAMMAMACSKDSEGSSENNGNIVDNNIDHLIIGKWTVSSINGETQAEAIGMTWEYEPSGNLTIEANGHKFNGTYNIDNNKLNMTYENVTEVVNIKDISMSSMIWETEILLGEPVSAPGEIVLSK
ncbi:MAG: hypothetical protein J6W88_02605 [Bacteroidales bacterium]|nr:hypothetical protein [Bacteroidales bacterium]